MSNRINLGRVIGEAGQNGQDGQQGLRGEKGDSPYIQNGIWWVGQQSTNVRAKGNSWFEGDDAPSTQGVDGDMYLRSNGDVYQKENGVWGLKLNIKGQQGVQGERGTTALTFAVGDVETGEPAVVNVGTEQDIVLNFTLPQGQQGVQGERGQDGNSTVFVGGLEQSTIAFSTDPQTQLDGKLNRYQGTANAGKILQVDTNGNVVPVNPSASSSDIIEAYIVGDEYTSGWLSTEEGGTAIVPQTNKVYVIKSEGTHYLETYIWNLTEYAKTGGKVVYENLDTTLQESIDAIDDKVDKVAGKGLSTNDYTTEDKNKLASVQNGAEANVQPDWDETSTSSDAYIQNKPTIPTKTSDLTNDSGFITNIANDLVNYYLKSETYTKTEVDNRISAIPKFSIKVVNALPVSDISDTTVYLLRNTETAGQNLYDEYIYVNDGTEQSPDWKWEKLGSQTVDLSGYVQTSRKINNKALTSDITLDASDVGALPSNTTFVSSVNGSSGAVTGLATTSDLDAKYTKPTNGIPATDLTSEVQASLTKADNALTSTEASNTYMTKSNPVGTGSFSINRKANTEIGNYSHAEGYNGTATQTSSHAEGYECNSTASYSHAEGLGTTASGSGSHAEGNGTTASGNYSHAQGQNTTASGTCSHAEGGGQSKATANYSHAEGYGTMASGTCSHAEGEGTVAQRSTQKVFGTYNVLDTTGTTTTKGKYIEIVGKGTSNSARSNARTLDWNGNEELAGTLTTAGLITSGNLSDGTNSVSIANIVKKDVSNSISGETTFNNHLRLGWANTSNNGDIRETADGIYISNEKVVDANNSVFTELYIGEHSLKPVENNLIDLGASSNKWKDLYLSGVLNDGTNSISIANIVAKQNALTFDTTPTANSTNPVTSGGIKTALDGKQNLITLTASIVSSTVKQSFTTGAIVFPTIIMDYFKVCIQWGNVSAGTSNEVNVTFPKSFAGAVKPTIVIGWQKWDETTREWNIRGDISNTGFTIRKSVGDSTSGAANSNFSWIAIGLSQ